MLKRVSMLAALPYVIHHEIHNMPRGKPRVINKAIVCVVLLLLLTFIIASDVAAQDAHYWTQQFGTRSELLGGVVVGSPLDLSATFYNPGGLVNIQNTEVLLSGKAFEYRFLTVENAGGLGGELTTSRFTPSPSLFTGLLPKWFEGRLAYSVLTKADVKLRIDGRVGTTGDILPNEPGDEIFYGEIYFDQSLSETWGGLSWATNLSENVGIGATGYVAYHSQRTRSQTITQAAASNGLGAAANQVTEFDYWHYRVLAKIGISAQHEPWTLGLTMTTPSLSLFGSGSVLFNNALIGLDLTGDGLADSRVAYHYQDGLGPDFRSPFSLSVGGSYEFGQTKIHATTEWFAKVDKFVVLDATDFQHQTTGETISSKVTNETKSITNVGVGVEHAFRENFSTYGSAITDFSARPSGTDTNNSISTWDIYHVSAGTAVNVNGLDLTTGLAWAFGSDELPRTVNLLDASEGNQLSGSNSRVKVTYRRLKFLIGFAFAF